LEANRPTTFEGKRSTASPQARSVRTVCQASHEGFSDGARFTTSCSSWSTPTGFFSQSIGWITGRIGHWKAFVGVGVRIELVALAILLGFFKRRGWF
jgi:hypothetical protein